MIDAVQLFISSQTPADLPRLEQRYLPRLHPEEQARYRAFPMPRRRLAWLTGRALALSVLASAQRPVRDHALRTLPEGGIGYMDTGAPLHLSLTHTGGLVILAVAAAGLGVDLEQLQPRGLAAQARRFFTPLEAAHLMRVEDATARLSLFYDYWTLKEAVCKAAGLSLWQGLRAAGFDLRTEGDEKFQPSAAVPAKPWQFWLATLGGRWRTALALRSDHPTEPPQLQYLALGGSPRDIALSGLREFKTL